jgi:hypothetical protein
LEIVSDWKTVRRAADNSATGNPRFAHYVAYEVQVHGVAGWKFEASKRLFAQLLTAEGGAA